MNGWRRTMRHLRQVQRLSLALGLSLSLAAHAGSKATDVSHAEDGWDFSLSAAALERLCQRTLARARRDFAAIEQDTAPATLERVFGAYDAMKLQLQAIQHIWYMKSVHPDPAVQQAATECIGEYRDFALSVDLSAPFYRRVAAIDLSTASAAERLMVANQLRDFHQAGVDRDSMTRERVKSLVREISDLGNRFDQNIREDRGEVAATEAQLEGLPEDFRARRPADEDGFVTLSTDRPDYLPVMRYSDDDALRRDLYVANRTIATPANGTTLRTLIERRHELATLLGYPSHAALATDGLMVQDPQRAQRFLAVIGEAVKEPAARDMSVLGERLRQLDPDGDTVQAWQVPYLSHLVRQEDYAVDMREVRRYFHFERVQAGIFDLTRQLFGVQIVPWQTDTWHEDVTAWEIRDGGKPIGRFYLDLHPRAGKYKHAAHWSLRTGLKDRQLPLSGMATNFPRGLMEHAQVATFLHEFGHLLHNMFSGGQRWLSLGGLSMERDFVEAPSQMLEEWAWNYDTLARFAVDDAGQPIPRELVEKMNRSRQFGAAAATASQVFYANLSLNYHNRDPDSFELLPLMKTLQARYSPFPYVEGTHFYNNFGHLNGYSSNYYIYQWSRAISFDLLTRFRREGMLNRATARDFRDKVLAPGGSGHAADYIRDFLGRTFSDRAYTEYLEQLHGGEGLSTANGE